ncbi:MAG TPA: hypothetical protein VD995_30555 [Azospirillum sp.]|nr:hypothetical protein [Azospirillum sp.]
MITRGLVPECLDGIAERMVCVAERLRDGRAALRLLRRASQVNTLADRLRHRRARPAIRMGWRLPLGRAGVRNASA